MVTQHTGAEARSNDNRLLRVVVPMDAASSIVFVVLALAAGPTLFLLHPPSQVVGAVGYAFLASAVTLGALGAITACSLLLSMARGRTEAPADLWRSVPRPLLVLLRQSDRSENDALAQHSHQRTTDATEPSRGAHCTGRHGSI
jgi:hypothetical protein